MINRNDTIWLNLKEYLNVLPLNSVVKRKDLVDKLQHPCDNYRNWLCQSGYMRWDKRGVYKLVCHIPWDLTTVQLRKEAYPNYYNTKYL